MHLKTVGETLKAGQDDFREELTKKRVKQKIDMSDTHLLDHEERLEALDEEQLSTHKN